MEAMKGSDSSRTLSGRGLIVHDWDWPMLFQLFTDLIVVKGMGQSDASHYQNDAQFFEALAAERGKWSSQ
jgi:hypothetical protein